MSDIERIEVIHRPDTNVWGANAVNSFVKFDTKNSVDTEDTDTSSTFGTEHDTAILRLGDKIKYSIIGNTTYRTYSKYHEQDDDSF